jgi:xanthine/uracil permease
MASIPQQNVPDRDYAQGRSSDYAQQGRSLMSLFSDLWRETRTLVHQEAELAKAEISEKVSQVTTGAGEIAAGGAILFAGFIVLLFAAVGALELMLATEHSMWLAPLIVGLVVMIVGYIVLSRGRKQMSAESLTPDRTLESLQRDARLAKEHGK